MQKTSLFEFLTEAIPSFYNIAKGESRDKCSIKFSNSALPAYFFESSLGFSRNFFTFSLAIPLLIKQFRQRFHNHRATPYLLFRFAINSVQKFQ